jgi:hypothetical protein
MNRTSKTRRADVKRLLCSRWSIVIVSLVAGSCTAFHKPAGARGQQVIQLSYADFGAGAGWGY